MSIASLKSALAVLEANDAFAAGSFLHALHERDRFDATAFWVLDRAMTTIAAAPPGQRGRGTRARAVRVHRAILLLVIHHLNPQDGARIRAFPVRRIHLYLARLDWTFAPVSEGVRGYGPVDFGDGLKPPR